MVIPWKEKIKLYNDIESAIHASIPRGKAPHEPDYIAALVLDFARELPHILKKFCGGYYRVGGCFLHQKPLAKFCDPSISDKRPEIGDLLIVYKEVHPEDVRYNALLLQAKRTDNIYRTYISDDDMHQLTLYTQWPKFAYARAGHLNNRIRNIIPKTVTSGAQYLLIDDLESYHSLYPAPSFWCAMPQRELSASNTLALQIVKFLEFQVGRPFVENPTRNDWSQMIWDLLHISAESRFNRKRSGHVNQPRSSQEIFDILSENYHQQEMPNNQKKGITVLCIEGRVEQERPR